jgi:hypothetical protein
MTDLPTILAEHVEPQSEAPFLEKCPHCSTPTEISFGLAGGGFGPYCFCPNGECHGYFVKHQTPD